MPRINIFGLPFGEIPSIELANKVLKESMPHSILTIISYHGRTNPNTNKAGTKNYWKVRCECGIVFVACQDAIMHLNGNTISCGCYNNSRITTHGDAKTSSPHHILYTSWRSMKRRSEERTKSGDTCHIHTEWHDYLPFKEWSLANGWHENMVLCRNGDVGDYTPDNCRWDSQKSNMQEGRGRICKITSPDGDEFITTNGVNDWCRENQHLLPQHIKWGSFSVNMSERAAGRRTGQYYGWACEFIRRCNDK